MEFLPWETHGMIIKAVTGGREILSPWLPGFKQGLQACSSLVVQKEQADTELSD